MSHLTDTLWPAEPHTKAKLAILERYLDAWMPIVTAGFKRAHSHVCFIDGFAGPGEYLNHRRGSPIVAVDCALHHSRRFEIPVDMVFIEQRRDRVEHLTKLLQSRSTEIGESNNLRVHEPIEGDCETVLKTILERESKRPPTFVFLDQFGYTAAPMTLIAEIMAHRSCEALAFIEFEHLTWTLSDESKHDGISNAWGGDEWKPAINMAGAAREEHLFDTYRSALRQRGNVEYVAPFRMYDKHSKLLYWLFFCTNDDRGLKEMKDAMMHVDPSGSYLFSDRSAHQPLLLRQFDDDWLAGELLRKCTCLARFDPICR